ncbi:DUF4064 domain-containing protein [Mammaliicoccus sciuri]|uniref:DUF4064 domain-containing protein n=1 Tax=Mammaliicoccus sciuri TaxID=1296 RepID=UPI000D1DF82B|nr:DUF4064 domain-containing protein [Mammaliicoccus sciuri]PTK10216.1 hypothetical protein BU001_04875 [Mammaliicoccus sciuri]
MINRTMERVLIWIGIAIQIIILLVLVLGLFLSFSSSEETIRTMMEEDAMSLNEATSAQNILNGFMIFEIIWSTILMGIAIITNFMIKNNSKVAGILFIVIGILSILSNWIAMILWIIAGILILNKKKKSSLYNDIEEKNENPFISNKEKNSNDEVSTHTNTNHKEEKDLENPYKY